MKNNRGFTLLEVMIAVTIMAFITMFTARMIRQGLRAKDKIETEMERTSGLKDALAIMSSDIQNAFHYQDINVELYNAAQEERKTKSGGPTPPPNATPTPALPPDPSNPDKYQLKEVKVITQFLGENDKIDFTALSNFRATKNVQQSDQSEIGYYLENCSSRLKKQSSSQCLWRRVSPYIDDEVKEGGTKTPLLENVKSLKFRYLGPSHEEEWVNSWRTKDGEEVMKDQFPYAVEITLTIEDPKTSPAKEVAMTVVAPLRFPNNRTKEKSGVVN